MSGGTFVPRNECPGGHFFQGDSHSSDTGTAGFDTIDTFVVTFSTVS